MVHFDPTTGSLVLPVWAAATLAALLVALVIMAMVRSGPIRTLSALVGLALVGYAAWAASTVLERVGMPDRTSELRAFEQRAHGLLARATQPGSTLGCLDQMLGEQLLQGCERAVFGSPENVTAAVSFVNARLLLLVDALDAAARSGDTSYDNVLNMIRSGLEIDQFGVVAHVLSQQANCQAEQCEALTLLRDPNKVRVHLQDKTFDGLVKRYADTWGQARPIVDAGRPAAAAGAAMVPSGGGGAPVASKYEFPSSNSIPPVSIMNSEPAQQSATAAPASTPPTPRRPPGVRAPVAARNGGQDSTPPAPVQLAPAPTPSAAAPAAASAPRSTAQ